MDKRPDNDSALTHSGSLPSNVLVLSFVNVTVWKPASSLMVSSDDCDAKSPFGRLRSTIPKSNPFSSEILIPVPSLSKYTSFSPAETLACLLVEPFINRDPDSGVDPF